MSQSLKKLSTLLWLVPVGIATVSFFALAQQPGAGPGGGKGKAKGKEGGARAPLFFRESWKQSTAGGEHAVTPQEAVSNPNLELKVYGPDAKDIQLTGSAGDEGNPIHLWNGITTSPIAATLRDKNSFVDLTGVARIKWNTKMSGLHRVHPVVKLADGTWLIGDRGTGSVVDWHDDDFSLADVRWLRLDIEKIQTKGNFLDKADLSKVDEVGFADLMAGSGHGPGGWADVGQIEVYGKSVPR
ncbi:MAG TPA: hypothetical protein VH639_16380 [Bryobacteraceae bacterium]|jgi:hypothetical protein